MKLHTLKPALSTLAPRIHAPRHMRHVSEPGREWYKTRAWKKLRMQVFERDLFTCQWPQCKHPYPQGNTSLLIGHHKTPHRGERARFFDEKNVQTVCKTCHDSYISSQERTAPTAGIWD
jgi:5-methylcytosine-specific restriction protein A